MDKFIQVKQGSNILYLPKEAYHQLVQDYKDMMEKSSPCNFCDFYDDLSCGQSSCVFNNLTSKNHTRNISRS